MLLFIGIATFEHVVLNSVFFFFFNVLRCLDSGKVTLQKLQFLLILSHSQLSSLQDKLS